jgi:L-Ala-D/L-Glu epimerase / N-acetyl-D-glutamate racemase
VADVDPDGALGNPARCAVELSLLDAFGRRFGQSMADIPSLLEEGGCVAERRERVRYSGVVTAQGRIREYVSAAKMRLWGFAQVKVKVGMPGVPDQPRLRKIRRVLGRRTDIRVDANGGWTPAEALDRIRELAPLGVTSIEQPIADDQRDQLPELRRESPVRIMLDESLASWADAQAAVRHGACDLFNLRLSKCGGFIPSLRLAALAKQQGLGYQLGCQVGETGILSAAGRAFAASVREIAYHEGSYDRHLVKEDLLAKDITFAYGGWAPALGGPGLGVNVDRQRLEQVTQRQRHVQVSS